MSQPLRVLIVEDSEDDAILLKYTLQSGGFEVSSEIVDTPSAMRAALETKEWDIITSDHAMPYFCSTAALELANELRPDLPFIIVSGEIDINLAVLLMRGGAKDYVQKRELPRLVPVIERELREVALRRQRLQIEQALQVSETRYRRLFETAQDGILILDADTGLVIDVNPFLITMLGYSKAEFLGKQLWELGTFMDEETSKRAYLELQSQGYIRYDNLPLRAKDGKQVAVEFVSNVYLVDHMRIAQCNIRDITERELGLIEIHKLNAELEQRVQVRTTQFELINKELEAFNYSVSHDLRAPLRRVMDYTEILKEVDCNKQSSESLHIIHRIRDSVGRMNTLIDALLKLSRFSQVELKRQAVDLSIMAHIVVDELQQANPTRRVKIDIAEGILADGDEQSLRIVMENLLDNAWKFTSHLAIAQIEFGTAPQVDGSMAYFVRDDGAGFDMGYADKLFGAFQRLHSEKEFPGIGIGLATVQRIIHRHGGRIWVESKVDKGATFYFTISGGNFSYKS